MKIQKESFIIVFRKKMAQFNSIENVFNAISPYLVMRKVELPEFSNGALPRIKNIKFLWSFNAKLIHITGYDHYLLLFPFKKAILTIHDIESLKRLSGVKRYLFKLLWFDIPIMNSKLITTISSFSKSEIETHLKLKKPIHVIFNPISLPLTYQPRDFKSSKPRILQIGVKQNKNLIRLIKAIANISCELVIIGKPTQELEAILIESRIDYCFEENLSNEDVMNEYYSCDLVSFVSTYEGFGLPIIEAQACGRVVITSNCCSMPEVGGEGALYVDPFSEEEIRLGIINLINNKELREKLIQKGLENVDRFRPTMIAEQYNNLYIKVAQDD